MKLLSKLALLLFLAGLLAILLSVVGVGPRWSRMNPTFPAIHRQDPPAAATKSPSGSHATPAIHDGAPTLNERANDSFVRMPAIRGENNYGWVQLPRGTSVELLRHSSGDLVVRWDGITVRIPQTAADTGAISLRQPTGLTARN